MFVCWIELGFGALYKFSVTVQHSLSLTTSTKLEAVVSHGGCFAASSLSTLSKCTFNFLNFRSGNNMIQETKITSLESPYVLFFVSTFPQCQRGHNTASSSLRTLSSVPYC